MLRIGVLMSVLLVSPALAQPPKRTSLSDTKLRYRVAKKPYVVLKRGGIEAVIVDNQAVDDTVLPGHRAGYSGVAALRGAGRKENLFVPAVAGLNFEHIHDGTVQDRKILFEPRNAPMQLRLIDDYPAELYQAPTPHYALESCHRYQLLDDGTIELPHEQAARRSAELLLPRHCPILRSGGCLSRRLSCLGSDIWRRKSDTGRKSASRHPGPNDAGS